MRIIVGGRGRAVGIALAFLISGLSFLVGVIPTATAATRTWTTDADFNEAGAEFAGTEVVGGGTPASVHLLKDFLDWSDMNPAASPGVLEGPGLSFAAETGLAVLFGGRGLSGYSDETWEYNLTANTWTQVSTTQQPSPRQTPGMSYDPVAKVVVLFGGYDNFGSLNDAWEYDVIAKTWTEYTPTPSPPELVTNPLAYDASASRHILAGWNFQTNTWETWAYDASTHTWQMRTPATRPGVRQGHALAYDAALGATVMFGGSVLFTFLNDTWEYRYATDQWVDVSPVVSPSTRAGPALTYATDLSSLVLFGGTPDQQETWLFDAARNWNRLFTSQSPPARQRAGMAYDLISKSAVMYGGITSTGIQLGDTWVLGTFYRDSGRYTSARFDSVGANVDWQFLFWNLTLQPPGTTLQFQLAASSDPDGPFIPRGPDGLPFTFYTVPGMAIWSGLDNQRYLKFVAELRTTDPQVTPDLADVTIVYNVPPADPYIVSTDPPDASTGVPLAKIVRIAFSEPMDTASVNWQFLLGTPVTFIPVWSSGDTILDLTHPGEPFAENKPYRLLISGQDLQGRALVPNPIDPMVVNPFTFVTAATYPFIVSHTPNQGDTNVPLPTPIVVDFSEAMDTASVTWTLAPSVPLTPSWSLGDTRLTLTHPDFVQCSATTVQVDGRDRAGLALVPGPVPNPWSFTTACINPYITATSPMDLEGGVAVNRAVVVDFSEPMNTSSVILTISPDVDGKSFVWSAGNTKYTMTHSQVFTGCRAYEVTVTGNDVDGNPLIPGPPGSPPNPWSFFTVCANPYIITTTPEHGAVNVSVDQEIIVAFSEAMDTATVTFTITPSVIVTGTSWDLDQVLHIQHSPFTQCTRYTVQVTGGRNVAGFPLVPGLAPNPWSFDTICVSPQITLTSPADGAFLVPVDQAIRVEFSKPMDTIATRATINPLIALTRVWSNGDRTLTLTHATNFADCTLYDVTVTGLGVDGSPLVPGPVPNPWDFTTRCAGFYLVRTDPADLEQNVPFDKSIVVEFSQAVDVPTFTATLAPAVPLTAVWSAGNTIVTLSHTTLFPECRWHTVTVTAKNTTGVDLQTGIPGAAPNPWTFRTTCIAPYIVSTDPPDGATNVPLAAPIIVDFSEAMLRSSVTWTIAPTITVTPVWSNGDRTLTLTHTAPFQAGTLYSVTISGTDLDGVPLAPGPVPNPWSFTTGIGLAAPRGLQVIRMLPDDILLTWQPVAGAMDYVVYSALSRFSAWPWPQLVVVTTTSYLATSHLTDGSPHYYIVRARDSVGAQGTNSTMGVKQPLSFSFSTARSNIYWLSLPYRTMYKKASDISGELTSSRIDVVGKWNPATQSSILWFYFRGAWRGTDFPIAPGDGLYIGARSSFSWVINGTDGSVPLSFTLYPPPNANVNWISLPYTSTYQRASDLVLDIEGSLGPGASTKIVEVARWDPLTQTLVRFYWTPTGWTGTDFTLGPGEGVYLKVVANFAWTPRLITPEVP